MRIGIFTFHRAINYGAVLQTYGLQEVLSMLGHDVYVIDIEDYRVCEDSSTECRKHKRSVGFWGFIKSQLRELLVFNIRRKRKKYFNAFVEKKLRLKKINLYNRNDFFDVFVFGSDQIWNPKITNGISPILVGCVPVTMGKRLISYAASIGHNDNLSTKELETLKKEIFRFDALSVREKSLKALLGNCISNEISIVLDPVLLAGREVYEALIKSLPLRKDKRPYLLFFTLSRDEYAVAIAKKIAKEKKLDFIEIVSSIETITNLNIKQTETVCSFVNYFKNANYVITTSYHGMIFSILFERDFNVMFDNDRYLERSLSILTELGIKERLVNVSMQTDIVKTPINYSDVAQELHRLRKESNEFLVKALDNSNCEI